MLPTLTNNEDIHGHVCGEYVLEQLQNGVAPAAVVQGLLEQYLVRTTKERVLAYRWYREQRGDHWTLEHLERLHWEWLYAQVGEQGRVYRDRHRSSLARFQLRVAPLREAFCLEAGVSEQFVPLRTLTKFFSKHEVHARLPLEYPEATVVIDSLPWPVVEACRLACGEEALPGSGFLGNRLAGERLLGKTSLEVAGTSGYIAFPLESARACLVAAYATLKGEELFAHQSWYRSFLTLVQRVFPEKYPKQDFAFWVKYGSWSWCPHCASYRFNDTYFSTKVYQDQKTSETPDLLAAHRRRVPTEPLEHVAGAVGVSSRWWYLPQMYQLAYPCGKCTPPLAFVDRLRQEAQRAEEGRRRLRGKQALPAAGRIPVQRTAQLYRVPRVRPATEEQAASGWASECVTWPRYLHGGFSLRHTSGESMLELSEDEAQALQVVCLVTSVRKEGFGANHQFNWKKIGLSRAYFRKEAVTEATMPTPRAQAAYRFLLAHNKYYEYFHKIQAHLLKTRSPLNVSSYDLFVLYDGIECAMYPVLYPTTDFTDTGILAHYKETYGDDTNRICSIGLSWTKKAPRSEYITLP